MTGLRHLVANECCVFVSFLAQNGPLVLDSQYRNGVVRRSLLEATLPGFQTRVNSNNSTQIDFNPTTASTVLKVTSQPARRVFVASLSLAVPASTPFFSCLKMLDAEILDEARWVCGRKFGLQLLSLWFFYVFILKILTMPRLDININYKPQNRSR